MKIYATGEKAKAQPSFIISICPARHLEGKEMPAEWVTDENEPLDINVEFKFGMADVPSNVAEYMIRYGMAAKTPLILPRLLQGA